MSINPNFELLKTESIRFEGETLYRIKALKSFKVGTHSIKKDHVGGYVRESDYLEGRLGVNMWVDGNAKTYSLYPMSNVFISNNAIVVDSKFYQGSRDIAEISDYAQVYLTYIENSVSISQKAYVESCKLYHKAAISGNARVVKSSIFDYAQIYGNALVENSYCYDHCRIYGNAKLLNKITVKDYTQIYDEVLISGRVKLVGSTKIHGDAVLNAVSVPFTLDSCDISGGVVTNKSDPHATAHKLVMTSGMYDFIRKQVSTKSTSIKKQSGIKWYGGEG